MDPDNHNVGPNQKQIIFLWRLKTPYEPSLLFAALIIITPMIIPKINLNVKIQTVHPNLVWYPTDGKTMVLTNRVWFMHVNL